ncbi:hypothetical protein NL676_026822 [Syzygium grande]|nr:hypothetical protein NL676_026822 [Syzygium grande]
MAKKRKSVASRLDEVDRSLYSSFCSTTNSLFQLYTQAMNYKRLSFQAGERAMVAPRLRASSNPIVESNQMRWSLKAYRG